MKIGIDISQVAYPGTGVATYTKNLVENLLQIDKKNNYVLFAGTLRQRKIFNLSGWNPDIWPLPPTVLDFLWNRLHVLPVENLIGNVDVFHSSDWTMPPTKAKKVTTIFDMVVYKYPQTSHPKIIATQKRRLAWVKKEADAIITISEASKKDIVEILGVAPEKVKVIYLAAGEEFKPAGPKFSHPKPYLLAVGTQEPRKNLVNLIAAYKKLSTKDLDLIIVGKHGWGQDAPVAGVINLGYVAPGKLPDLYRGAKCFVYPSLYEGFGVPVLEAMACGCPVVTSNVGSLPEVGGDGATYVDPLNVTDIADKLAHVKRTGREMAQAKKFSWEKTARETLKVYEALA
ncbi:MAG: glycosyltransferase family 4 protein [Patescibacteria group bacterium]|nr:glycosyltransferase family 4 protein [Patescibacteria group bacterium]MCL5431696.1 glycosyltransferase family 4 protein [Patescibacteria group bacterium]